MTCKSVYAGDKGFKKNLASYMEVAKTNSNKVPSKEQLQMPAAECAAEVDERALCAFKQGHRRLRRRRLWSRRLCSRLW